jgi:hypothetical protein
MLLVKKKRSLGVGHFATATAHVELAQARALAKLPNATAIAHAGFMPQPAVATAA